MTGPAWPSAASVALHCPADAGPQVAQLCEDLTEALRRAGYQPAGGDAGLRIALAAHSPRPDTLIARLTVEDRQGRREGELAELSVMDRPSIPRARIRAFAGFLLQQAGIAAPDR